MGFADVTGEREDIGERDLVPGSHYPVKLTVGTVDVGDVREDGKGGSPFFELIGLVTEGPFKGKEVNARMYFAMAAKGVAFLPFFNAATNKIAGKAPDETVLSEMGYVQPTTASGEDTKEYGRRVRESFAEFFAALTLGERLVLMQRYLRLDQWSNKQVVAHVELKDPQPERNQNYHSNSWAGFFALNDSKRGLEYVRKVSIPQQLATLAEQAPVTVQQSPATVQK